MHDVLRCPFTFILGKNIRTTVDYLSDFLLLGTEKDMHAVFPTGKIVAIKEWWAVDGMTLRHVISTGHRTQKNQDHSIN